MVTEQQHPKTMNLGQLSRTDLPEAYRVLKDVDLDMLAVALTKGAELEKLHAAIKDTLKSGGDVHLYGCGATGRLSMTIAQIFQTIYRGTEYEDRVLGYMSGGERAFVYSFEGFEDRPDWGARQVSDAKFGVNDLMIAITEGGETPSVIGAVEQATQISNRKPFFLYCNPTDILRAQVKRSRHVIDNTDIEKIELTAGPMALSGSTRMQASTIQMLIAGAALFDLSINDIRGFVDFMHKTDVSFLIPYTEKEADLYKNGDHVLYVTDDFGMTVITDTTERAPTFSLPSFENYDDKNPVPSWCYMLLKGTYTAYESWCKLIGRTPKGVEWDEVQKDIGITRVLGFLFGEPVREKREALIAPQKQEEFQITREGDFIRFQFGELDHKVDMSGLHPLFQNLYLKMLLNMHSTLLMGRMERFESNVMTWVKPSNNKLIDRSIRYIAHLMQQEGMPVPEYKDICYRLFEVNETLKTGEPIVMRTLESYRNRPPLPKTS